MRLADRTRDASKFAPCPVDPKLLSRALRDATIRALAERNYRIALTKVIAFRESERQMYNASFGASRDLFLELDKAERILETAKALLIEAGGEP
jgi:hypothetical protein